MAEYTVTYRTADGTASHFRCHAPSAYDARIAAMELNEWVHAHPNAITGILTSNDQW